MTQVSGDTRSVVMEREFPHPPAKIWRALTLPHLIREWLMKTDFTPAPGQNFTLSADWGTVDCRVLEIEPERSLSYTWEALGLESVVVWTLAATPGGTLLRMEQTGFEPEQQQAYNGAKFGWPRFFGALEGLLARID